MEKLNDLLQEQKTSTDVISSKEDTRTFEEKKVGWFNDEIGHLNQKDGIDCPKCKNKGNIASIILYDGYKEFSIAECDCMKKRRSVKYAQKSGMGELLKCRAKDFQADEPWQKELLCKVTDYVQHNDGEWMCLLGQSGAGKTLLCSAVANSYLTKGIEVHYCVWGIVTKELKHDMFSNTGTQELLYKLQTVPVLYIDDLFKGKVNDQDVTLMFDLLNYRYNSRLVTLITSEMLIEELANVDIAIAGRIKERCGKYLIQLSGENKNYRFK